MRQDSGDETLVAAEQQWSLTSLDHSFRAVRSCRHKVSTSGHTRRLQQQQILAKKGQRELAMAVTSCFCSGRAGADGNALYTLLALVLQHVFLYFL